MSSIATLKEALAGSVAENTVDIKKAAVLFSGGIDSSLIALLVSQKIPVTLYCVGMKESSAIKNSSNAAKLLSLPLKKVIVSKEEISKNISAVKKIIKTDNFLQLSIALPEFFALKQIKKDGFKHVFCGQGADELFFGYDEFLRLLQQKKGYNELEKLRTKKLENLYRDNLFREFLLADYFSLSLHAPYLHRKFVFLALKSDAKENVLSPSDLLRKHVLRELAKKFIPSELADAKKKAMQYDSAIAKELKSLLKKGNYKDCCQTRKLNKTMPTTLQILQFPNKNPLL